MAAKGGSGLPQVKAQVPAANKTFREFKGINTQSAREAIEPDQFAWLENLMPIGFGNLKCVNAPSGIKQTIAGDTVYYRKFFEINGISYMFYAGVSGAIYALNLTSFVLTTIVGGVGSSGVQISQWKNERILIITTVQYYSWDGTTLAALGGTTGAPSAGQCIQVYAGRVWISQNRTINWSEAGSYTDFTGTGGNTIIADPTLLSDIQQLVSANSYLYFLGIDSINVIADAQVVSGALQFSNTNISSNSGSDLPQTIFTYYRSLLYMNRSGVYALYGSTTKKISDELDGIFPLIDFTKEVTGGTVMIYNILCAAFMFTYNDPIAGTREIAAVYFNKKWFLISQGNSLMGMATANLNGLDTLFADDGSNVCRLFQDSASNINSSLIGALWDFGDMVHEKEALKLGVEINVPNLAGTISPTIDSESYSAVPSVSFTGGFAMQWFNSTGAVFSWLNSLAQPFVWLITGYQWFQGDVENTGHYLGFTVNSNTPQIQYVGLQLQYRSMPGGWGE